MSRHGLNVVGYFRTETGVGEAGRLVLRAVQAAGIPHRTVLYDRTLSRQDHPFSEADPSEPFYDTNLICVNADQMPLFSQEAGSAFFQSRYTIGMWHWEVEEFPWELHDAFRHVQEVWTASEFARRSVAKIAPCPVFAFPLPIQVSPTRPDVNRVDLGLPEGFMFLFVFDFYSVLKRKNPLAAIEAFRRAFTADEGAVLVLKTVNGKQKPIDLERVRAAVAEHPDVYLIDGYLGHDDRRKLTAACDCYVSLHRSEGFGLTIAEAMAFGKPVIATGYSGNLEFMSDANSYLVPYTLQPIGIDADPYPPNARWAEPDVDAAAQLMRDALKDPETAAAKGERARQDLLALHGPDSRATFIRERLETGRRLMALGYEHGRTTRGPTLPLLTRLPLLRAPARLLLRALASPREALRNPSPRYQRIAAILRRLLRRPYRLIWRAGSGLSDASTDERQQ